MKHTYHYCSRLTGELQTSLIKSVLTDHLVNFRWEYRREGF